MMWLLTDRPQLAACLPAYLPVCSFVCAPTRYASRSHSEGEWGERDKIIVLFGGGGGGSGEGSGREEGLGLGSWQDTLPFAE